MKLPIHAAAEFLECSPQRVLELLRERVIPGIKAGQSWVIPEQAFYEAVNRLAMDGKLNSRPVEETTVSGPPVVVAVVPKNRRWRSAT